jgi:hypothetical protein
VEGIKIHFIIQVDTLCHRIPNFIEKCARAGVRRVFIGLENINPDSLVGAKKRQNKITEYRKMLLAWKAARVITYAGYILGFPNDTFESIERDIEIIKKELPVDLLEFFFLTPLPGSEDHQVLVRKGVAVDADLNKYDLNHVTTAHARMSAVEWERAYRMAWEKYYTTEHVEAVLRRLVAMRASASNAILLMTWFKGSIHIEEVHPLEAGFVRYKFRSDRRPGLPRVPAWRFYPSLFAETVTKLGRWVSTYAGLRRIYVRIKRDPRRLEYTDLALTPVTDAEMDTLEMFHHTEAAEAYVARERRPAVAS